LQRLFFHNPHDKTSRDAKVLLSDDIQVISPFEGDDIPSDIKIPYYPYLIDKQIVLDTQSPYYVGTITLNFNCCDHEDGLLTTEDSFLDVEIEGTRYNLQPENGVLQIELTCEIPQIIDISINGEGYYPFNVSVEVEENVS